MADVFSRDDATRDDETVTASTTVNDSAGGVSNTPAGRDGTTSSLSLWESVRGGGVRPLSWGRRHGIAAAAIAACCVAAVTVVWADAPVRHSHLSGATSTVAAVSPLSSVPTKLHEVWRAEDSGVPAWSEPLVDKSTGLVFASQTTDKSGSVRALDPGTGHPVWTYDRDVPLCSWGNASWGSLVAVFRTGVGCGDVTAITAANGHYAATRSAVSADDPSPIMSNSAVGTVSPERLELWRNDLVRTVEYGVKEAKQEPGMQPNEDCRIDSALTRTDTVAIVETCPAGHVESSAANGVNSPAGGGEQHWLRFITRVPKDSRKPEFVSSVALAGPAHLVAVGQKVAAVMVTKPDGSTMIESYSDKGAKVAETVGTPLPADAPGIGEVFTPMSADLPHHMSFFDGKQLRLFAPDTLNVDFVFPSAIGTPVSIGGQLLVPTREGYDVTSADKRTIVGTIAVDRGGYVGPVGVAVAGSMIVEKRGDVVVALAP